MSSDASDNNISANTGSQSSSVEEADVEGLLEMSSATGVAFDLILPLKAKQAWRESHLEVSDKILAL